jgi:hypothetical protein
MINIRNLWVIRPESNFVNCLDDFIETGNIVTCWPDLGNLGVGLAMKMPFLLVDDDR